MHSEHQYANELVNSLAQEKAQIVSEFSDVLIISFSHRFLMNNVSFYFRSTINSHEFAYTTLNKLYQQAAEKYIACC